MTLHRFQNRNNHGNIDMGWVLANRHIIPTRSLLKSAFIVFDTKDGEDFETEYTLADILGRRARLYGMESNLGDYLVFKTVADAMADFELKHYQHVNNIIHHLDSYNQGRTPTSAADILANMILIETELMAPVNKG